MMGDSVEGRETLDDCLSRCEVGSKGLDDWGKIRSMKLFCILFPFSIQEFLSFSLLSGSTDADIEERGISSVVMRRAEKAGSHGVGVDDGRRNRYINRQTSDMNLYNYSTTSSLIIH